MFLHLMLSFLLYSPTVSALVTHLYRNKTAAKPPTSVSERPLTYPVLTNMFKSGCLMLMVLMEQKPWRSFRMVLRGASEINPFGSALSDL